MRCHEFEIRLQDVLDARGSLADDCELAAHAARCADCRDLAAAYDTLFDTLAATVPAPPRRQADRVLGRLARRTSISSRRYLSMAAAAAVLLVASVSLWRFLPRVQDHDPLALAPARSELLITTPQEEAIRPAVEPVQPAPIPTLSLPVVAQSEREAIRQRAFFVAPAAEYTELARETGRGVATLVKTLPKLRLDSLGDLATERAGQPGQWMSQMTDNIGPLTSSMAEALESLLRAITPPADSAPDAQAS